MTNRDLDSAVSSSKSDVPMVSIVIPVYNEEAIV